MIGRWIVSVLVAACSLGVLGQASAAAGDDTTVVAQAEGTRDGDLEPRYQPREPEPPEAYNDDYVFAMTRGVAAVESRMRCFL